MRDLPNPFVFESASRPSRADQLAAHVDHAAVLSIPSSCGGHESRVAAVSCEILAQRSGASCDPLGDESVNTSPHREGAAGVASGPQESEPFFSIALLPSAEITAELEAGIADIVADLAASKSVPLFLRDPSPEYLAASSNHIALRSLASNSTFIPTT